jgi:phospholipase C
VRLRSASLLALAVLAAAGAAAGAGAAGHRPRTPIRHFVTILQENHTYDNYFGTYPHGEGLPLGVCQPIDPQHPKKGCVRSFHLGENGIQASDLDHSAATYQLQWNHGRLNGFVHALNLRNQDGRLAMGYWDGRDIPYYWNLADQYALYDHFFSSARAGSFLNHVFWVTGGPAGGLDRFPPNGIRNVTTIFDRLQAAGVSWKFYVQNYEPRLNFRTIRRFPGNRGSQVVWVPLLAMPRYLDNPKLRRRIVPLDQYFDDLHNGTLPAVSYIVPSGPSEHPPSRPESGQAFVRSLINALVASPDWASSAFLLAYDDWGGWYDHVNPPQVDRYGYGFRVPAILVSPYSKRAIVHTPLDFTSILRFIEENWNLKPLGARDARVNSIASGFDFSQPPRKPEFTSPRRGSAVESHVRRGLIYTFYGGALALPGVLAGLALLVRRRRPVRRPGDASG